MIAKIFKVSGYLVDPNGQYTADNVKDSIDINVCDTGMFPQHLHVEEKNVGKWKDELPINKQNCDLYECEKYFKGVDGWPVDTDRKILLCVGDKYRHFKGKVVQILMISQDTEMPGQFVVVYKDEDGYVWHRPLGMFISEVDHEKYPDVEQKYRFERIKED